MFDREREREREREKKRELHLLSQITIQVGSPQSIETYMKICIELSNYFGDDVPKNPSAKVADLRSLLCATCHQSTMLNNITHTGHVTCNDCARNSGTWIGIQESKNVRMFTMLPDCIQNADALRLLTYSKWTPIRCDLCSVMILPEKSERLPAFDQNCTKMLCYLCSVEHKCVTGPPKMIQLKFLPAVIKEFRGLFKNKGIDTTCEEMYDSQLLKGDYSMTEKEKESSSVLPEQLRWVFIH